MFRGIGGAKTKGYSSHCGWRTSRCGNRETGRGGRPPGTQQLGCGIGFLSGAWDPGLQIDLPSFLIVIDETFKECRQAVVFFLPTVFSRDFFHRFHEMGIEEN
jgi:hypothetical protein